MLRRVGRSVRNAAGSPGEVPERWGELKMRFPLGNASIVL